jgi:hypothetical protein
MAPAAGAVALPAHQAKASAPGSISVQLLDASAARKNDPRARLYIDDNLKPGTTIVRHIRVNNTSAHAVGLRFYPDSATVANGSFNVAANQTPNELTSWTTVQPAAGTIPGGGHVVLTVTVAVPTDAEPGERYGVVLADVPPAAPTKPGQIAVGARVGIRMYLSVSHGKEPVTDFRIDSLTGVRLKTGQPEVLAQVHNTGGRALDLSGTLLLDKGPGGLHAGPYPVVLGTTLGLGQTAPVRVPLDPQLPAGPWRARLTLNSGTVSRAAEATLLFPTAAGTSGPAVAAKPVPITKRRSVVIPVAGSLLGLLALAFLLLLFWRRRRKKDDDEDAPAPPPAGKEQVLAASRRR